MNDRTDQRILNLRNAIDTVDNRIIELLQERATLAHEIGQVKKEIGMAILDPGRESLLRRIVDALIAGKRIRPADLKALNDTLSKSPTITNLQQKDSTWRLSQISIKPGFERILATIAFSFASMLANGDPTRIKICANPDCGWVIYDESHNRTRRWCDVRECGNLIKVRQFRARKSAAK